MVDEHLEFPCIYLMHFRISVLALASVTGVIGGEQAEKESVGERKSPLRTLCAMISLENHTRKRRHSSITFV